MESPNQSRPGPVAIRLGGEAEREARTERFELGEEARGPWSEDAAHGGAPAALLARVAARSGEPGDLRLASLATTFHGPVPLGPISISSAVVKPGRRQRVVALELTGDDGRVLMAARAVLLRRGSVELPPPAPAEGAGMGIPGRGREIEHARWAYRPGPAFHRTANTVLAVEGGPDRTGPVGAAWFRLEAPLVAGEPVSGVERAVAAADFGNGVAHPVAFGEYLFVNCDLNVSLMRDPVGEWIGIRARTGFDPGGAGVTVTDLYDRDGRVGAATQTLFLEQA